MITGFIVPASRSARTRRPGSAPMYVRRWPRISASSRTPPSDIRTNSRPSARAIDSPIDVLPVPGGPISVRIAPDLLVLRDPALLPELAHGEVLDDAILDVLEPVVIRVEDLAREHRVEPLVGPLRPRHGDQPVEVRADHRRLGRLLAHPLEPVELPFRLLQHLLGHAGLVRSSSGTPRRRTRRPRRAPCGSTPSGAAGCTPAAASGRPTRRRRGCACESGARRAARAARRSASSSRSRTSSVSSSSTFCANETSGA